MVSEQAGFVDTAALVRLGAVAARQYGFVPVVEFGATLRYRGHQGVHSDLANIRTMTTTSFSSHYSGLDSAP